MNSQTSSYDVLVVGSGAAGVSAAYPLVEAGLRVLMVDGGKQPQLAPFNEDFLEMRLNSREQWKWFLGEDYHALRRRGAVSPKLRVPSQSFAFEGFQQANRIVEDEFITVGSLASGGLTNAWGCGVARFSDAELAQLPFPASDMMTSYAKVARRMGISGRIKDDLSEYFGLDEFAQAPIQLDALHSRIYARYEMRRDKLMGKGFRLGRSRVAALSEDLPGRQACNLSRNCLWGCARRSLYSAHYDLEELKVHPNFNVQSGFIVETLHRENGVWSVTGSSPLNGESREISVKRVILAAGTLATSRLVLQYLNLHQATPMLSCPVAGFLLWVPSMLGAPATNGFGLGQLSFQLGMSQDTYAFGSTFSPTGLLFSEFASHLPMGRRHGMEFLRGFLSSCLVGNLFLPGHFTQAELKLRADGSLLVSGKFVDEVAPLMTNACKKLRAVFWSLGAVLLPRSFTVGMPGGDIHYSGTLPMRRVPALGETSSNGEVEGMENVYVADGACMPILPAKSHTLSIMANADRIGSLIAKERTYS